MKPTMLTDIKTGFLYYAVLSLSLFCVFLSYIPGTSVADTMTPASWLYYITAALSQAALFSLIPYLLSLSTLLFGRVGRMLYPIFFILFSFVLITFFVANKMVYSLYRFHINGFILEMLTGDSAGDIFQFDIQLYVKVALSILFIIVLMTVLWHVCRFLYKHTHYAAVVPTISVILFCAVYSNLYHAYAAVVKIPPVIRSATVLPYYAPLTANRFMQKLGVVSKETLSTNIGGG